jgi:Gluconolactonase
MARRGMMLAAAVCALVAGAQGSMAQEIARGTIVAPGAELELVFSGGFWLEGPAQGPDGRLYLSDITMSFYTGGRMGAILAHDPVTGSVEPWRDPSGMTNGLAFGPDGALYATSGADFGCRCVLRTDPATGQTRIIAGTYEGRPFNAPNDLVVTRGGTVYFTDPRFFGHEPLTQPVFAVYRVDPDGTVTRVIVDAARPNGLALSPDERTLYVAENDIGTSEIQVPGPYRQGGMDLLAYALDESGAPGARRVFVAMGDARGSDGLETDSDGNLYATIQDPSAQGIHVYSPTGDELAMVPTPTMPTNVALVEADGQTWLYATGGANLYRIQVLTHRRPQ